MEEHIQIGKYTLESPTTGMYSDSKIIYREYIQNSVDALEEAVESNLIEPQGMRIDIIVDAENDYISIRDNGTGIASANAVSTLMINDKRREDGYEDCVNQGKPAQKRLFQHAGGRVYKGR